MARRTHSHKLLAIVTVAIFSCSTCFAQLPQAEISSLLPAGGKQGATVEVQVTGSNLDDLTELVFSHPGIKAVQKMQEMDGILTEPVPVANTFVVTIAADCPTGIYEARAIGHFGASNPRSFAVNNLEESADDGSNKTFDKPREVQIGNLINGVVDAGSRDYFKLSMKKDERVLVSVLAQRIDSKLDSSIVVYDTNERELTRVRGGLDRDADLDFAAPADGEYIFGLSDFFYGGGNTHFYRLQFHTRPHIDFVLPPSGKPGSNDEYTVYGRNLPGGQPAANMILDGQPLQMVKRKISIPNDWEKNSMPASGEYMYPVAALIDSVPFQMDGSNVFAIGIAGGAVVTESDDNDAPTSADEITVPCEYVGQFYPARDKDWVQFAAKTGDVYNIELISHRLGLGTDPYMTIQSVKKKDDGTEEVKEIAQVDDLAIRNSKIGSDFDTTSDDPSYRLEVKEDGIYRLALKDQFGDGRSDPRMLYRLSIAPDAADFSLVAVPRASKVANNAVPYAKPTLRAGGSTILNVKVERRGGLDGEIEIAVTGLPEGVTCEGVILGSQASEGWLIIQAAESAAVWHGPIQIVGKALVDGKPIERSARAGAVVWSTTNRTQIAPEFRVARDTYVSVIASEKEPATVTIGDGKVIETCLGGKVEVPVKVLRRGDFKADLKLVATGMPNEIKPADVTVKGAEQDGKVLLDIKNGAAKPGSYTFYFVGDAKFKYARNPDAAAKSEARHKQLEEAATRLEEDVKKATTARDDAKKAAESAAGDGKAAAEETMKKAEEALKAATDQANKAKSMRDAAKKKMDEVKKQVAPKDVTTSIVSSPLRLRIAASPIKVAADAGTVKQGAKFELPIKLEKLFGFDEQAAIELQLPKGVSGIAGKKFNIEKGKADGKLEITAADNATVGEHQVIVRVTAKFNNVNVKTEETVTLKVDAK